jgi:hypothetical protein
MEVKQEQPAEVTHTYWVMNTFEEVNAISNKRSSRTPCVTLHGGIYPSEHPSASL